MPRSARLDAPGTLHHVILRGIEKRAIVDDDNDRQNFVTRMGEINDIELSLYFSVAKVIALSRFPFCLLAEP
jgi:hypothetical protein